MKNARTAIPLKIALAVSFLTAALFVPINVRAAAGGIQNCVAGSTCTVGEFLFDDSSNPLSGQTCTITSNYPDNTSYVPITALSGGGADGWYYYSFTAPTTTGVYPTTISCTVSGDTLTIDKSFQVNAANQSVDTNAIASAVWGYGTRTVSSFGSLIADIWSYKNTGTVTAGSTLDDIKHIRTTTDQTRLLIEKVANQPIITNVLEDTNPSIGEKIQNTRATANQVYVNSQYLTTQSAVTASAWNATSGKELLASFIDLSGVLGEPGDAPGTNTLFGELNYLKDSWNWDEVSTIYNQLITTQKMMDDVKSGLADYQKSPAMYQETKLIVKNFASLEKTIGKTGDTGTKKTLFAKIKVTSDLAQSLDNKNTDIGKALADYSKTKDATVAMKRAYDLQNQVIALNTVPGVAGTFTKVTTTDPNSIQNLLLSLKGIINSNQKLLALGNGKTLVNTWLEIGSIVFKTLATNPSTLISQEVNIKYYLPPELKEEDIIKTDSGLTVTYDSDKGQLFVSGTYTLAAGQTKTLSVETKDIWLYSKDNIASLRTQAETLAKPLVKTSYYAQSITLTSDINAKLDQMVSLQEAATTPEEKIQAYRDATILKAVVDSDLKALQDLVTQASAAGNLFGFVGGSQTIAVWGIIVVVAAGFVFLTVYMKAAAGRAKEETETIVKDVHNDLKKAGHIIRGGGVHPVALVAVMMISSAISAGATGYIVNNLVSKNYEMKLNVLGTETQVSQPVETPMPVSEPVTEDLSNTLGTGGQYIIVVGDTPTGFLNVRKIPLGGEVAKVYTGDKLIYLDEQEGWYKVQLENGKEGWVSAKYATKE